MFTGAFLGQVGLLALLAGGGAAPWEFGESVRLVDAAMTGPRLMDRSVSGPSLSGVSVSGPGLSDVEVE